MPRQLQKRTAKHQTGKSARFGFERFGGFMRKKQKNKGKRNADRRVVHEPRHADECHHPPALRARRAL